MRKSLVTLAVVIGAVSPLGLAQASFTSGSVCTLKEGSPWIATGSYPYGATNPSTSAPLDVECALQGPVSGNVNSFTLLAFDRVGGNDCAGCNITCELSAW